MSFCEIKKSPDTVRVSGDFFVIGAIETIETIGTIEAIETIGTIGTIETIEAIETIEIIAAIEIIVAIAAIYQFYTLKRKCMMSPSCTTYSLPSTPILPASLTAASEP